MKAASVSSTRPTVLALLRRAASLFSAFLAESCSLPLVVFRELFHTPGAPRVDPIARLLRGICERSGGALPKVGQILSTRADLFPTGLCTTLSGLQDDIRPIEPAILRELLSREYPNQCFRYIDLSPVASATVAQVHRAVPVNGHHPVALKVLRPGIERDIRTDTAIAGLFCPVLSIFLKLRGIPMREAVADAQVLLVRQCNVMAERANLVRLKEAFHDWPKVLVPQVHPHLCTHNVLCMDFVPGMRKLTDPTLSKVESKELLVLGLRALYRMIFELGFVHCDLHPGNLMVAPDGRLVLLDAGLIADIDDDTRMAFAQFFAAVALRNGYRAAKIVRETAAHLPDGLDVSAFDIAIADWVTKVGGLTAREFQIIDFVGGLFAIQRRFDVRGTSRFTMMILALLVYEGTAKQVHPDLDFQATALPFVLASFRQKGAVAH
jgi:ubiquinone biosynthesis protein